MAEQRRHIVLVGHMGSGKTTLGQRLAEHLELPFCDSDATLLHELGRTARDEQQQHGRRALHRLEAKYLLRALANPAPHVICAAASTIDDERCRRALSSPDVDVIWLRAPPEVLAARYRDGAHRPPAVPDAVRRRRDRRFDQLDARRLDTDRMSEAELLRNALAAIAR